MSLLGIALATVVHRWRESRENPTIRRVWDEQMQRHVDVVTPPKMGQFERGLWQGGDGVGAAGIAMAGIGIGVNAIANGWHPALVAVWYVASYVGIFLIDRQMGIGALKALAAVIATCALVLGLLIARDVFHIW